MGEIHKLHEDHGCTSCFEVNRGYLEVEDGRRICKKCGGFVLIGMQEAMDHIAELKAALRDDNIWRLD